MRLIESDLGRRRVARWALGWAAMVGGAAVAHAQPDEPLASYFGFEDQRIIVVDDDAGPVAVADFNGDRLADLAIVNNRASRIELHTLRRVPRTDEQIERDYRVNELPPNRWYDRTEISVRHRIGAIAAFDADRDGRMDLIYLGADPQEIVTVLQREPGQFVAAHRRRQSDLVADPGAMAIGDVLGAGKAGLVAIAGGRVGVFPIETTGAIGQPVWIGATDGARGVRIADLDGDGQADLLIHEPNSPTPLRVVRRLGDGGGLAHEIRLEGPAVRAIETLRVPGQDRARIAVIETSSRRIVLGALRPVEPAASGPLDEEVQVEVGRLSAGQNKACDTAAIDLDGDGMLDLLATDPARNELVLHRQQAGAGLRLAGSFPTFKRPDVVVAGQWDGQGHPEVFVLSREEKAVGVSRVEAGGAGLSFPEPIQLATPGAEPTAMALVDLNGRGAIALVVKQRRDLFLELHPSPTASDPAPAATAVQLTGVSRAPQTILATDANRDGLVDLLLLTPREPMVLVLGEQSDGIAQPTTVVTRDEMRQFGIVSQAGPDNTVLMDIDGDGFDELVLAEENFVRACAYDDASGWRVVEQTNIDEQGVELVSLAQSPGDRARLVAGDGGGGRLFELVRSEDGAWSIGHRLRLLGFDAGRVVVGSFDGAGGASALVLGDAEFAVVPMAGGGLTLQELAVYRDDHEGRIEHFLAGGDVNSDGYADLVVLDAGEQMCSILSISRAERLVLATSFKVFESRLFMRGDSSEFQPSRAIVADLTGDARDDLLLLVHDRVIVYPQKTER